MTAKRRRCPNACFTCGVTTFCKGRGAGQGNGGEGTMASGPSSQGLVNVLVNVQSSSARVDAVNEAQQD